MAPVELSCSVMLLPLQEGPLLVAPVDDGIAFTVTVVAYMVALTQPSILLTVSEYVVVAVGVTTGLCIADVEPSDPCHDHPVALVEWSDRVTEVPLQTGLLLVAPVDDGTAFTVTIVVYAAALMQPSLLVTASE